MRKYVLDTNLYIAADRDMAKAEELIRFYSAFLPFTYLHAVVVQELLLGAVDLRRAQLIQDAYIAPFEARDRLLTPSYENWKRSGVVVATLVEQRAISPGGFGRSFLNDVLLAVSCREAGVTLVTSNVADFERIRQVERFEFLVPWPEP
ncbi:MAG: type II toxin-antitoxin system VapC family toxin [Gemmatimonadaceae bacterium]